LNIIYNILYNNPFPILPSKPVDKKKIDSNSDKPKRKWVAFTYTEKETTFVTKLFRQTNFKVSYGMNNCIELTLNLKIKILINI